VISAPGAAAAEALAVGVAAGVAAGVAVGADGAEPQPVNAINTAKAAPAKHVTRFFILMILVISVILNIFNAPFDFRSTRLAVPL
jgi:hypothetical protein